ncbi:MAG: type 2 isopentenyl-diphosphate Delta-isomerase [Legionellaceae bacterium]|nr:type 2 isopentenyl-diphosphate Delta-isomerase [Legionellaceae bacterium]
MPGEFSQFEKRKQDHIDLALMQSNQTDTLNQLDKISLVHEALPDFNFNTIDISAVRLGRKVASPFLVSSMTAGHADAKNINQNLMEAASISGWAMGVGSQRRELTDKAASHEWTMLRKNHPLVSLFGNLGIAQLISSSSDDVCRLTDALVADGLIIHCNPLQECIQPEGTTDFSGSWQALENLVLKLPLPVIVKETGCGFSKSSMQRLIDIGVSVVDVSGVGGTHWGRIEGHRAQDESMQKRAAHTFRNWGIDTVSSVIEANSLSGELEIWGSGGVRHGLDAAKLIALGASSVGFAKPLLKSALVSPDLVLEEMRVIEYELKIAMFCTGSSVVSDLGEKLCR